MKKGWKRSLALCLVAVMVAALMPAPAAETAYAADEDYCRQWWIDQCEEEGIPVLYPAYLDPGTPLEIREGKENHVMVDFSGMTEHAILEFDAAEPGTYMILAKPVIISVNGGTYRVTPFSELGSGFYAAAPVIFPADESGTRVDEPYVGELKDDDLLRQWGLYASTPFECE